MTPAATTPTHSDTAVTVDSPSNTPAVQQLVQRIAAEVDAAAERVRALQAEAEADYSSGEQRFNQFVATAQRIQAILEPRLQALTTVSVFTDVKQSVNVELRGPESRGFHAITTKLTVPGSDKRPTGMGFSFRVDHDSLFQNAIVSCHLEILPLFIEREKFQQLMVSIDAPDEAMISAWIDDRLVGFTKTYFEVYFHSEYQKKGLQKDPVLNIRFPGAMSVATQEYQSQTYHFFTEASSQRFRDHPADYIETDQQPNNARQKP